MDSYISQDKRVFDLQILDGNEYVTAYSGSRKDLEVNFACFTGKPRRLVIPGKHPARPKYRKPCRKSSALDRIEHHLTLTKRDESVIAEYLQWAKRAGIKSVAVYDNYSPFARIMAEREGLHVRKVAVSDFLGEVYEDMPEIMAA
jgi:hypothetical protein